MWLLTLPLACLLLDKDERRVLIVIEGGLVRDFLRYVSVV